MADRTKIRNGSLSLFLLTGLLVGTAAAQAQFNDLYLGTGAGNVILNGLIGASVTSWPRTRPTRS